MPENANEAEDVEERAVELVVFVGTAGHGAYVVFVALVASLGEVKEHFERRK